MSGWTPVTEDTLKAAWKPVQEAPQPSLWDRFVTWASTPTEHAQGPNIPTSEQEVEEKGTKYTDSPAGIADKALTIQGAAALAETGLTAVALRSIKPFYPVAKGVLGAIAGKHVGREVGGLVGEPEWGGNIGALTGSLYGASGGKFPNKADVMEFLNGPEIEKSAGAHLPSVDEFYANRGAEIMKAMKQQPEAFGLDIPKGPSGAPLPSASKFYEMRGREIMAAMKQQPEAFGVQKAAGGGFEPIPSKVVSPDTPALPINKTYVSYDGKQLLKMAKSGDVDALRELIRSPRGIDLEQAFPNLKYLVDLRGASRIYGGPGSTK